MPVNPLQVWQCCFKSRPLAESPARTQSVGSDSHVRGESDKYRHTPRESDWLSVFLDHPFLVHHLSFAEIKNSDLSARQTFNLATLVPDAVVKLKNIWQKEPETYIGVLLCADVSGFTNLCEQSTASGRGTYHITAALNHVFGAMVQLIYTSDGDVLKFSGDSLLAVWKVGKDQYLFDVIHQVLSCALLIQNTLIGYRTEANMALKVKVAISAGMLHFSLIGSERARHYVVVGKPVEEVKDGGTRCVSGDVLVAASAWDHCCPRNYDHTTKDGLYIKVSRILYNPGGKRVYMTKVLHSLGPKGENRNSVAKRSSYINIATPSSYSIESLSQRSSLPMGSANDSSPESSSSSSSSVESFASDASIEIPLSSYGSLSDVGVGATSPGREDSVEHSFSGFSMSANMADVTIRPSVAAAARQMAGAPFRPFMIPPVAQQVDADQPLEYLTEMRHVTTMFVNVVPDRVTNEALIDLVDHVYSTVCRLVYSSLGVVNKVSLFDKDVMLLCVFGLRGFKHQQESQSALRCGTIVKRTLHKFRGVRYVSVGITTGTAYCGVIGHPLRREYTVVGPPVNHAARLMVAYPGKVSCEQNTKRLSCLPAQLFRSLPRRTMKGIKQIEEVYEYHEDTRMSGPVLMTATGPLLGRDEIIAEVEYQIEPRRRKYQVMMVMGEPRIGKSRLLTVMANTFVTHTTSVLLQLQPVHSAVPLAAAHFIARQILGLNIAERQARLRKLLPDVSREDLSTLNKKLAVNFPRFVESQSTDDSAPSRLRAGRRETAIKLIVRMVQALVNNKTDPLSVFFIDDAQYADEYSSQVALDVVRMWKNDPQLKQALGPLIVAAVSVSPQRPPPAINRLMANLACVRFITLGPLPSDLLPALACQLLNVRAVEIELVRVLEENSRGNPGWCESYLSALLSSNGLRVQRMALSEMRARTFCVPDTALLTVCQCDRHLPSTSTLSSVQSAKSGNDSQRRSEDDFDFGESSCDSLEEDQEDTGSEVSERTPEEQGNESRSKDTQGEAVRYLRSVLQAWRAFWRSRLEGAAPALTTLPALGSKTAFHEYCLRTKSGRCSACSMEDESKMQPVCLLAPHLDYNQEVAAHLNGAIVASFDSLPPMEQLLLKCGSVLGDVFHRSVLLQLLKGLRPVSKRRVILAMQRLFEMCVLECSVPGANMVSTELACRCQVDDTELTRLGIPRYALCRLPRFRAQMVRSAVWDLLPIDQRRALHIRAARCLHRRRPVCAACRARARLSYSSSNATSSRRQSGAESCPGPVHFSSCGQSNEIKDGCDGFATWPSGSSVATAATAVAAERSSTDSTRKSTDSVSSDRRKSSFTNPVRFSVGLMGPTRTSSTGPTKPALRKATPVGQEESRPPRASESSDRVQVVVDPPSTLTQPSVDETSQRLRTSTNETPPSIVEIILPSENLYEQRHREFNSNSQDLMNAKNVQDNIKRKPRKTEVKRVNSPSSISFSTAMASLKERFGRIKNRDVTVSLKYLMSCLPTAPCNNCECPMLLADVYRRLIEHCSAAGLKLHQLRFMTAYGALTMAAGYPVEAILALAKAIQVAQYPDKELRSDQLGSDLLGSDEDVDKLGNKKGDLDNIIGQINVLIAEAHLQIGDLTRARHFVHKETSCLPWKRSKASVHAHAVISDIYTIEGDWVRAEREALKAGDLARWRSYKTQLDGDATWALAGAIDAATHTGHLHQSERLERAIFDQTRSSRTSATLFPGESPFFIGRSPNSSPEMTGSGRRRSVRKTSVADPRRARAAARLLYSIFVSRLCRGRIKDVLEPGEAALSAAEAMGATFARAAILPQLALTKLLLLEITQSVALISYFRKVLGEDSDNIMRDSTSSRASPMGRHGMGSPKTSLKEDFICLSTAEYHCIRLDATLYVGVALRDAHREAEQFIQPLLGSKSILNLAARRVAARLSLYNARKGKWTECALLATMASPSLTILETDPNLDLAEIGNSALFLLEAALYGRAVAGHQNELAMSRIFDKIPQWISSLRKFVKKAPMLIPRFLLLSSYYKMLRGKREQAMEEIETALSIAEQQGNCLNKNYISLHKAVWQGEAVGLSVEDWLSIIERNDEKLSQDILRFSTSPVPLASMPSGKSVETPVGSTTHLTTDPPPPSPADPHSAVTVQSEMAVQTDFVSNVAKSCRRSIRLSMSRYSDDEDYAYPSTDDSCIRRWEAHKHSTVPTSEDTNNQETCPSIQSETVPNPDVLNAIFFCLPSPASKKKIAKRRET